MSKLNLILENWYILFTLICIIILSIQKIVEFIGYPTKKKIEEIKNRALIYVSEAEKELGSNTGKIKLSKVYDTFCREFPYVKKWISIEKFDEIINDVLPTMRNLLNNTKTEQSDKD